GLLDSFCCDMLDPSQRAIAQRLLEGSLAGKRQRAELTYRDVAGRDRIGSITSTPIVEHGRVTGALCIVRDVTQERRFADELRQREKLAAVGQLVSGVAHELNNPLAGISAFAQLLEGAGPLTPEQRDAVNTIHMEAKRAAKIVSSLLLFSRQRQPERTAVDLNRVLLDTLTLRRFVLSTEQIEVATHLDAELPPTWADPFQLQQVLLNLLINAEQALRGRKGKRRIILRTMRTGDRILASVADNGPGMSEEMLGRIFEPFFTTKAVGEGSGLGLAISHGIVRQHGGTLRARSTVGAGAAFEIDLPVLAGQDDISPTAAAGDADEIPRYRRFLIVDSEPAVRQALQLHLRRTGCFADAVGDANAALALLATRSYGAIFLDLHLGDIGGETLFAELVERDPDHAGRVIFATGDLENPAARLFLQGAGRPFLGKPFALSTVAAMLSQAAAR
ncbi:MAG: ATP-binding protein, partial [Gemmatimonadota bacterium]|nr:ATP-binding protein [Gemmatimonadota bacterium]